LKVKPFTLATALLVCAPTAFPAADEFSTSIRPILEANCKACHNPANPKARNNFLKSEDPVDVDTRRTLWRSVATQLRNRTMPPGEAKLAEADRLKVANWIEHRLRTTGCTSGPYAGYVPPRRLNRREYRNTIRDLFGVDLPIADLFPADEAGGAGFDTNGDTLYIPPMMLERYMEAAQKIADRVLVSPPLNKITLSHEMTPPSPAPPPSQKPSRWLSPGEELSTSVTIYNDSSYGLRVSVERPRVTPFTMQVKVDGVPVGALNYQRDSAGGATARAQNVNLSRGVHTISLVNGAEKVEFYSYSVVQNPSPLSADQRTLHYRLLGVEPGQTPVNPDAAVRRMLTTLLPKAYRRPAPAADIDKFLALYHRAARRGDPFEDAVKYALKAVLVSPGFLFRIEQTPDQPGLQPLNGYDLASRLSYFLWSTVPDEELMQLAAQGKLQDPKILAQQTERMLDDPRSRAFADAFIGQWLGTQEIGGRAVPLLTELQHFYTPDVAADLREQPQLFLHYLLTANRPVLDLLNAPYTFLTDRLVKYYELEGKVQGVPANGFAKVNWPDNRRAGVLGLASVLAMTSHYKQASPVLRGAWVLETLLGTPVPPPPADVPPLDASKNKSKPTTTREMLALHRADTACAACHNIMDPVGLALENFDWMGRWRDNDVDGQPVDASGSLPSGEKFSGPHGLRQVLVDRKEDFLRHFTAKMLGYALGRGAQDGDQCTIQAINKTVEKENYSARALVREIVLSPAFRNTQSGIEISESHTAPTKREPRRLLGTR
jgi:hypothetical protein